MKIDDATHTKDGIFYKKEGNHWYWWNQDGWYMCFGDVKEETMELVG